MALTWVGLALTGLLCGWVSGAAFIGGGILLNILLSTVLPPWFGISLSPIQVTAIVALQTVLAAVGAFPKYRALLQHRFLVPMCLVGSLAAIGGAHILTGLHRSSLLALLCGLVWLSLLAAMLPRSAPQQDGPVPSAPVLRSRPLTVAVLTLVVAVVGLVSGMFGIGGGFLMVPVLMWAGWPPRSAVGHGLMLGAVISLIGTLSIGAPAQAGWLAIPVLAAGLLGSAVGAGLAARWRSVILRRIVMVLLLGVALKMTWSLWL